MEKKTIDLKKFALEKCIQEIKEANEGQLQIAEDSSDDENEP